MNANVCQQPGHLLTECLKSMIQSHNAGLNPAELPLKIDLYYGEDVLCQEMKQD